MSRSFHLKSRAKQWHLEVNCGYCMWPDQWHYSVWSDSRVVKCSCQLLMAFCLLWRLQRCSPHLPLEHWWYFMQIIDQAQNCIFCVIYKCQQAKDKIMSTELNVFWQTLFQTLSGSVCNFRTVSHITVSFCQFVV